MSSFIPRPIWPDDITNDAQLSNGVMYIKPEFVRYYQLTDICKYQEKFLYLTAQDFASGALHFNDVTDKVSVAE